MNNETKHTPGPWRVNEDNEQIGDVWSAHAPVAQAQPIGSLGKPDHATRRANAALIAAAPDLLEALKHLLFASENADETGYVTDAGFLDLENIQEQARLAIAKATGEQP